MEIHDAEPARRLRIAVGGGRGRCLLQRDDIREAGSVEGIQKWQLGRAGVAEEVVHPGPAQDFDQARGDLHQRGGRGVSIGRP